MAVTLKAPWRGHDAGAVVSLDDFSEAQLVRGGAAERGAPVRKAVAIKPEPAPNRREHVPLREDGPVMTPRDLPEADAPRRRGRPRKGS